MGYKIPLGMIDLKFRHGWDFLEDLFREDMTKESTPKIRRAILLTLFLYCLFGILDFYVAQEQFLKFIFIRFAVVLPVTLVCLCLTFTPLYLKWSQVILFLMTLCGGLGIIYMMGISPYSTTHTYYAGLILIFISIHALYRMSFIWATMTYTTIVISYELVSFFITDAPLIMLIQSNFFIITSVILCMIAGYVNEKNIRISYMNQYLLQKEKEKVIDQKQKMETLGILSGGIAHDFNNSLAAISGYSELTMDELGINSQALIYQKEIIKITHNAQSMIEQILSFGRKDHIKIENVSLKSIINDALKLIKPNLPSSIKLVSHIETALPILANGTQLHRVVVNLCTNSIQALRQSEGAGHITIGLKEKGWDQIESEKRRNLEPKSYLEFTITDNGQGIAPENIDKIFTTFFSTKIKEKGTGLGLSLVKDIIDHFNGDISVQSIQGIETTFTILLPVSI